MSNRQEILTPVGRLVQGSLYEAQTTDLDGKPLTVRTGANAGQPRVSYYFAIAIEKGAETHWNQTDWGKLIWQVGHSGFPGGQANSPHFAWKVEDGDSNVPNRNNIKNCDREGYPGHWVLKFSSGFAPSIFNHDGTKPMIEEKAVNPGDYIQVYGSVSDNGAHQQPGVFLNHQYVAFSGFGERILLGADPKAVGFGKASVPAGAKSTPPAALQAPAPMPEPAPVAAPAPVPTPVTAPPPHTAILQPAPAPQRVMLPAANGISYDQYIASGWTDQQLIQYGYMQA